MSYLTLTQKYRPKHFSEISGQEHIINNLTNALNNNSYTIWLGYAFERMCRKKNRLIAKILGFEAVEYKSGAFFNRQTQEIDKGFQIDLVFMRKDGVYTICEIKYLDTVVTSKIIP